MKSTHLVNELIYYSSNRCCTF